ncbi:Zinc finger matrin-type protein 5 [Frankliniella fusca]|uniref:Zinc finger matrin-type protein 5 n=1 Tax=Frankliniella fusca TaxID=407009 RepID=A0AAE1HN29_9NEOP|nr:Zinc finger matrin-type protein 5 [Frankliniella fusca]
MGKIRYYCEYCDRSFLDDLKARKKHLSSTQHARMRKLYYLPYRTAKEVYEEEKIKDPCRKFMTQNFCQFAENCKYSHYNAHQLDILRQQAEEESRRSTDSHSSESVDIALSKMSSPEQVEEWLLAWKTRQEGEALKPAKPALQAVSKAWSSNLPHALQDWGSDLPPSLQPWSLFNLSNIHVEDWG